MDKVFDIKDLESDISTILQSAKANQQKFDPQLKILKQIYGLNISIDEKVALLYAYTCQGGKLKMSQKRVSLAVDSSIFQLFDSSHDIITAYSSSVIIKKILCTKEFIESLDIVNTEFQEEMKIHLGFFISNMNKLMTQDPVIINVKIPRCMFLLTQAILNQQGLLTIEAFLASFVSISIKLF